MNKISFLRQRVSQAFNKGDYETAAEISAALISEQRHNNTVFLKNFAADFYNWGLICERVGDLEQAAEKYGHAVKYTAAVFGQSKIYAERLAALATVNALLGLHTDAYRLYKQAYYTHRHAAGENGALYADILYNMANLGIDEDECTSFLDIFEKILSRGENESRLDWHEKALEIREKQGTSEDILNSLHSIAFLHEEKGDIAKAAEYAERAMRYAANNDTEFAKACNYLASLYERVDKNEAALHLYDQALEITAGEAGREHSEYLNTALRRACLLSVMHRDRPALTAHEEVREIFERVSGKNHIFYANCLRSIAMLHKKLGNPAQSEETILEAMKIRRNLKEDILLDISFLIRLHLSQNNANKALEALVYALMNNSSDSKEYSDMLNTLVGAIQTDEPSTAEFMNAIEIINDREKIRPILAKWTEWENT